MPRIRTIALMAALLVAAGAVRADAQGMSSGARLELSAVYLTLSGDDFEDADPGIGFDIAGMVSLGERLKLAGGYQQTSHDVGDLVDPLTAMQVFVEPRLLLGSGMGSVTPFLIGRASWLRNAATESGVDLTQTGWGFGGGGGLMIGLGSSLKLHAGAVYQTISLGDAEADGTSIDGTDASGSGIVFRAGLSFGFGGGM